MDVILLQDVKNLGRKGAVVNVKDGFGRHLIMVGQASEANKKNMNDLKLQKIREEKQAAERLQQAKDLAETLKTKNIRVAVKVGKDGKLFGSVSTKEIAEAFKKQVNVEIDKKKILLSDPIKEIGIIDVPIKLHPEVQGVLHVEVLSE